MNIELKKMNLFIVITAFIIYVLAMLNGFSDKANILLAFIEILVISLIYKNLKNIEISNRKNYIFILLYCILWFIGNIFDTIYHNIDFDMDIILKISDIFYILASIILIKLGIFVIISNFKNIDKKQISMDFIAILICVYYLCKSLLNTVLENNDLLLRKYFWFSLLCDIILLSISMLMISTFRSRKFGRAMNINLFAFLIFSITDFFYLKQYNSGMYSSNPIYDIMYAMPSILFAFSSYYKLKNYQEKQTALEFGLDTPINYGNSYAVIILFLFLIGIEIILYQNGKIQYQELFLIFIAMVVYMTASMNYQNFIKNQILLSYQQNINSQLEKMVFDRTKELEKKNEELLNIVNKDILTSLGSRKYLVDILENYELRYKGNDVALFVIDIIQFKNINNLFGNKGGDMVLKVIANKLLKLYPKNNIFRTDSNEFVILIDDKTINDILLESIAQDISNSLSKIISIDSNKILINIAIGCAKFPDSNIKSFVELLKNAEYATKVVKKDFKPYKNYRLYDKEMENTISRRMDIESLLQTIDYNKEFIMHFQPQFSTDGSKLIGMESLLRWNSPKLNFVSPGEFIPIAESGSIIIKIVQWTLIKSMEAIKYINNKYNTNLRISINISPKYIESYNFLEEIKYHISQKKINPKWLDFEITEMTVIRVADSVSQIFKELNSMGINLSIDDFGTGYSSYIYLKSFKVDKLKIAKELIDNINAHNSDYKVVTAIINMAKALNIKTIAEGVEKKEQIDILKKIDCDQIQGYCYGKPVKLADFEKLYLAKNFNPKKK